VVVDDFQGSQPYHLVLFGEKSSLKPILGGIATEYQADLYLAKGDISSTRIHDLARDAAEDGRPLIIMYFCDCDPSGWAMPTAVAHKLRALKVEFWPELEFRCYQAALTPDQVRRYGLPESPVKESEPRGVNWTTMMGVAQTEVDALATLQPNLLRQIARDALDPFYDNTLDVRVNNVRARWRQQAQAAVDEGLGDDWQQRRDEAGDLLDALRDVIRETLDTVRVDADRYLPELPEIPVAEVDEQLQPMPLTDSNWPLEEHCRRLIARKNYRVDGGPPAKST
jgi:hypothetical protein